MKKFSISLKTKYISIFALAVLFLSLICSAFFIRSSVKADAISPVFFTPATDTEYYPLETPKDFYYDQDTLAVIQNDEFIVIKEKNEPYKKLDFTSCTSLKQVNKLNGENLLISDNGSIYKVSIADGSKTLWTFDNGGSQEHVGGNYFDINGNHLISVFDNNATLYLLSDYEVQSKEDLSIDVDGDRPVALNENGDIIYVYNSKIYKSNLANTTAMNLLFSGANPSKMIADNEFIYYIDSNKIYRLSINGGTPTLLSVNESENFTLGNVSSPSGICFKDGNLLISDSSLNAITEFKILDSKLVFTGFAVAKGATAYNRIGGNAVKVSNYGDLVAVLDGTKLSIIDKNATEYSEQSFRNYMLSSDNSGFIPNTFALGDKTALLVNKSEYKVKLLDLETLTILGEKNFYEEGVTQQIVDVDYRNGKYYILKINEPIGTTKATIYSVLESDFNATPTQELISNDLFEFSSKFTIDVFGNAYITGTDGFIYKSTRIDGALSPAEKTNYQFSSNLLELSNDFTGALFGLYEDKVDYYNESGTISNAISLTLNGENEKIKSFAMNFDDKSVYMIADGEGVLFKTDALPNTAISNVLVPSTFVLTSNNASVDNLKFYSVKEDALSFSVLVNDNNPLFTYDKLIDVDADMDFVYICSVFVSPSIPSVAQTEFLVLAGKITLTNNENVSSLEDVTVIINKLDATPSNVEVKDTTEKKAFIATGVSAYFLPVMTKDGTYALTIDNAMVRLEKTSEIEVIKEFNFLDKDFYFASFLIDGIETFGYIPKDFTTLELFESSSAREFSLEQVEKTNVYIDDTLSDVVYSLEEDTLVRVYSIKDGVAFIGYEVNGVFAEGYIDASMIKTAPNTVIRNILIFLCVAVAVCATSIYFILKKR